MKNITKLAVAAAIASVSAYAQSVSYTNSIPFAYAGTASGGIGLNFSGQALTLPQWDSASFPGQTLTGVSYTLTGYMYGTYTISNGAQAANFSISLANPSFSLAGPFGGSPALSRTSTHFGGGIFEDLLNVAPSAVVNGSTALGTSTTATGTDLSNVGSYIGSGTVTFTLGGSANLGISGEATSGNQSVLFTQEASKFGASVVSVTYTYAPTEVPEPSTYAAMGFVGLVAGATIWRRRQMAKKA